MAPKALMIYYVHKHTLNSLIKRMPRFYISVAFITPIKQLTNPFNNFKKHDE